MAVAISGGSVATGYAAGEDFWVAAIGAQVVVASANACGSAGALLCTASMGAEHALEGCQVQAPEGCHAKAPACCHAKARGREGVHRAWSHQGAAVVPRGLGRRLPGDSGLWRADYPGR
jgi:hypothetical protein